MLKHSPALCNSLYLGYILSVLINSREVGWAYTGNIFDFIFALFVGNLIAAVDEPAYFEIACELCMVCPLSWYLRATSLFLNSKDTTGTTLLHSLSLTFTNQVFNISIFSVLHQVISIREPLNDSMVWLSCSFQTVGSSYYRIAATLRTHWGGNTPSVSHVGSNQMRVLTVTISRMKMLFTSGELCPLCFPLHWLVVVQIQNMRILSLTLEATTLKLWGWDSCHTWDSAALFSPQG